jgi:hypothetical protein
VPPPHRPGGPNRSSTSSSAARISRVCPATSSKSTATRFIRRGDLDEPTAGTSHRFSGSHGVRTACGRRSLPPPSSRERRWTGSSLQPTSTCVRWSRRISRSASSCVPAARHRGEPDRSVLARSRALSPRPLPLPSVSSVRHCCSPSGTTPVRWPQSRAAVASARCSCCHGWGLWPALSSGPSAARSALLLGTS